MPVNNGAAAILLALAGLAGGGEVIVSRGELVEIGGGFRIPDVIRQGGARLVEVGSTNKTRLADYRDAVTAETRVLLKVHQSNFRMIGFTAATAIEELAALGRERGLLVVARSRQRRADAAARQCRSRRCSEAIAAGRRPGHVQRRQAARRPAGRACSWAGGRRWTGCAGIRCCGRCGSTRCRSAALEATLMPASRRAGADPGAAHAAAERGRAAGAGGASGGGARRRCAAVEPTSGFAGGGSLPEERIAEPRGEPAHRRPRRGRAGAAAAGAAPGRGRPHRGRALRAGHADGGRRRDRGDRRARCARVRAG